MGGGSRDTNAAGGDSDEEIAEGNDDRAAELQGDEDVQRRLTDARSGEQVQDGDPDREPATSDEADEADDELGDFEPVGGWQNADGSAAGTGGGGAAGSEPGDMADRPGEERSLSDVDGPMDLEPGHLTGVEVDVEEYDPATVEEEFGIDLTELEDRELHLSEESFQRLSRTQRSNLEDSLEAKHGDAYHRVDDWIGSWKGSSSGADPQSFELCAKRALGVGAPVRSEEDEPPGVDAQAVGEADVEAYRDIVRVSRAFLIANGYTHEGPDGTERVPVYRGIPMSRREVTGDVAGQLLSSTSVDAVEIETSVLSNHTLSRAEAAGHSDVFSIQHSAPLEDVADSPDVFRSGISEAEVHVTGGTIRVPAEGLQLFDSNQDLDATDIQAALSSPADATDDQHQAVSQVVKLATWTDHSIENDAAADQLQTWADHVAANDRIERPSGAQHNIKQLTNSGGDE